MNPMATDVLDQAEALITTLEQSAKRLQRLLDEQDEKRTREEQEAYEGKKLRLTNLFIAALEIALRARVAATNQPESAETADKLIEGIGRVSTEYGSVFDLQQTKGTIQLEMSTLSGAQTPIPRGRIPVKRGRR